jgi:single-stranded DNA-binding protein
MTEVEKPASMKRSPTYRKGDRVAITAFLKVRTYEKDGETKEIRELVVTEAPLANRPPDPRRPPAPSGSGRAIPAPPSFP